MELRRNQLLNLAGSERLKLLAGGFEFVSLRQGQSIHEPMEPIEHVFFFVEGMSSEIAIDEGGQRIEVGCLGRDGFAGDELTLTHDFLALMLGVRRSSVTTALHVVEGTGAIKASRSLIMVKNRESLKKLAGASYGLPEKEYERLFGKPAR